LLDICRNNNIMNYTLRKIILKLLKQYQPFLYGSECFVINTSYYNRIIILYICRTVISDIVKLTNTKIKQIKGIKYQIYASSYTMISIIRHDKCNAA